MTLSAVVAGSINWLGLIAGILMVALPFLGPWWIGRVGTGAMEIALSPFDISITLLGQPVTSDLVWLFLLAEKIAIIIAGIFMILGSLSTKSWWSRHLIRFGLMKPFWAIIGILILLFAGTFFINNILPNFLSGMTGGGGAAIELNIPYIVGTATSTIQMGDVATIIAPINLSLTIAFWVAVVTAALCIAARIYQRRFTR